MQASKPNATTEKPAKPRAKSGVKGTYAYPTEPMPATVLRVEQSVPAYAAEAPRSIHERVIFSGLLVKREPANDLDVVNWVHNRLSMKVVDRLLAEGISKLEIALVAPQRTLAHRRANGEALTIEESDRAVRLARVIAQAETVFGSKEKGMAWLRQSLKRFEGRTPLEMLVSDVGSRMVEEALVQIDEGFFA